MSTADEQFPTAVTGLPEARSSETVQLGDGDEFNLRIAPAAKRLGDATARMLAYNGSIPGPTLRVREGSEVIVDIENQCELEATVHWHGLRLENRYDGTHETQRPMGTGERYTAHVTFPDPGVYWYHPHIREDYGQEMGLYGNVIVEPAESDYWPPVHREILLTLDDILIEDGKVAPFSRAETTHSAMGRFGNVLLVGGQTDPSLAVKRGEVVRFFFTNTANTRVFRVALPGAQIKLVGGDSGHVEHEQFVDDVVLAPSERVVVDVLVDESGHCPECGMKLLASHLVAAAGGHEHGGEHGHHMHEHGAHEHHDHSHEGHDHAAAGGIEWEDDMVEINKLTTPANMRWKLIDKATGAENAAIDWRFRVGDRIKIRLPNENDGGHTLLLLVQT